MVTIAPGITSIVKTDSKKMRILKVAVETVFQPHRIRKVGNNSWKLFSPADLKLRVGQTELATLRAIPGLHASCAIPWPGN